MAKYIIGIDIGGSKIIAALVKGGKIFHKIKIAMPESRNEFLEKLEMSVGQIIEKSGGQKNIRGIGCGIAGIVDMENGIILNAPNLRFLNNFNIKNWLKKKFYYEIKIDNDARCFTRSEYLFGTGRGHKNIVGLTLGTGVGGGIIVDGKMIYGANGAAGELGHMIIKNGKDLETLTVKQLRKLKFSQTATKDFEKNLGIGFSNIINILDPEVIIIGGGAVGAAKKNLLKVKIVTAKSIISPYARKNVKILIGKLGENAGAIGAAALFQTQWQNQF